MWQHTAFARLFGLGLWTVLSTARVSPAELPAGLGCSPPGDCNRAIWRCYPPTIRWQEALDLDGDGLADFQHLELVGMSGCWDREADGQYSGFLYRDYTEALFPAPGVEVYIETDPGYVGWSSWDPAPGAWIEPHPLPPLSWWSWNPPTVLPFIQAHGLGHTARYTETFPCRHPKGVCREESEPGLLRTDWPRLEAIVGFRLPKADGWHLGWVQIRLRPLAVERPDGQFSKLAVLDWAVHPEPDTALRAGEHPRPALAARRDAAADAVVLSWHPHWAGWVLERQRTVAGAAWEPAPGVTNHAARLPAGDGPWFFRLRGP